ncbi:hypothetical protein R6Q57_020612 [Mikania cordata]
MSFRMQTLNEEEEYSWSQKDSIVRRTGRDILIAVDHGPKSKHAFDWALQHFCCAGDIVSPRARCFQFEEQYCLSGVADADGETYSAGFEGF